MQLSPRQGAADPNIAYAVLARAMPDYALSYEFSRWVCRQHWPCSFGMLHLALLQAASKQASDVSLTALAYLQCPRLPPFALPAALLS